MWRSVKAACTRICDFGDSPRRAAPARRLGTAHVRNADGWPATPGLSTACACAWNIFHLACAWTSSSAAGASRRNVGPDVRQVRILSRAESLLRDPVTGSSNLAAAQGTWFELSPPRADERYELSMLGLTIAGPGVTSNLDGFGGTAGQLELAVNVHDGYSAVRDMAALTPETFGADGEWGRGAHTGTFADREAGVALDGSDRVGLRGMPAAVSASPGPARWTSPTLDVLLGDRDRRRLVGVLAAARSVRQHSRSADDRAAHRDVGRPRTDQLDRRPNGCIVGRRNRARPRRSGGARRGRRVSLAYHAAVRGPRSRDRGWTINSAYGDVLLAMRLDSVGGAPLVVPQRGGVA